MPLPFDPHPDDPLDLEPRGWSEIYDPHSDDGIDGTVEGEFTLDGAYLDIHDGMRLYDGTVYLAAEDGWLSVDDLVRALREFQRQTDEADA